MHEMIIVVIKRKVFYESGIEVLKANIQGKMNPEITENNPPNILK
jgi:hypothetical protein